MQRESWDERRGIVNSPLILSPAGNRISACGNSNDSNIQEVITHE